MHQAVGPTISFFKTNMYFLLKVLRVPTVKTPIEPSVSQTYLTMEPICLSTLTDIRENGIVRKTL